MDTKAIFESFEIPWIGGEAFRPDDAAEAMDGPPRAGDTGPAASFPKASSTLPEPLAGVPAPDQRPLQRLQQPAPTPRNAPRPKPARPIRPQEVDAFLDEVEAYKRNGATRTPSLWNKLASELVAMLEPVRLDVDPVVFAALFKEDLVKVEGTTAATRGRYFQLPGKGWMLDGLTAQAEIRSSEHFNGKSAADQDATRRALAHCLRCMEDLARKHVGKLVPSISNGERWDHVGTLAQVLAVRSWLRGDVAPDAPLERQWWAVIGDEGGPRTDPRSRVDSWNEILQATDRRHVEMRSTLRRAVSLPQGSSSSFGLAAAATAVAAISSLIESFRMGERPSDGSRAVLDDGLKLALDAADAIADKLGRLPNDEFERLKARAARIETGRRGIGLLDHLARVDAVVSAADRDLPVTRRPALVSSWRTDLERLRAWPDLDARIVTVEDTLDPLLDDAARPPSRLALLASAAIRPAADIEAVDKLFSLGEQLVAQALDLVSDLVREGRSDGLGIDDIKQRGRDLGAAADAALEVWSRDG